MTLGSDSKKIAILGVLLVGAAIALYVNVFSGDSSAPAVTTPRPAAQVAPDINPAPPKQRRTTTGANFEFKPRIGPARPEDRPDPATIDPTLRLDLLAKVQNVEPEEAVRNLFQYGAAAPAAAPPKPVVLPTNVPKIPVKPAQPTAAPPPPGPPPAPTAPPMTFKYYGYKISKVSGRKEAFLLDGDDIFIAAENDTVKSPRYKVVRIGINSITIEDTQFKSSQTLPLQQEAAAG